MANYKSAIVTGGTGALGTAICQYLLSNQYRLIVPSFIEDEIELFKRKIGNKMTDVSLVSTDLTKADEVDKLTETALEKFGKIDLLANIAGGFVGGNLTAEMTLDEWEFMMNLNLKSVFLCCRSVLFHMMERQYGKIINVSARAGLKGTAGMSAYSTAKAGVRILTESIAEEVKDKKINVNAIMPSIIDTPTNRQAMPNEDHSLWVKPDQIAQVVGFLISEQASIINGATVPVYGRA
jgi:NAD(P)-dependent dehydrogenase (short-subunit alcohol dehydrogenase family)